MGVSVDDQLQLKELLVSSLSIGVPEVGQVLGAIVNFLWNPHQDVWSTIEAQVEALIQADLSALEYTNAKQDLKGLHDVLSLYQKDCANQDPVKIATQWQIAENFFVDKLPNFQTPGYELPLLLLFVQFGNMYLALLRDGVLNGQSWNWNAASQQSNLQTLQDSIKSFSDYVTATVETGRQAKLANTSADKKAVQPFRDVNEFVRQYTFNALDIAAMWPYFAPGTTIPNPPYHRRVCNDPYGTADDASGDIVMPPVPSDPITAVRVWADGGSLYAIQLRYGDSTVGPVQGHSSSGYNLPPYGGSFEVQPGNPIVAVSLAGGDHITGISFRFKDGTVSKNFGNCAGATELDNYGEEVNDIFIAASSVYYQLCVSCIIVGYTPTALPASADTVRCLYIASPSQRELNDVQSSIAQAKPTLAAVQQAARIGNWSAQRETARRLTEQLAAQAAKA